VEGRGRSVADRGSVILKAKAFQDHGQPLNV
jgi:hypothetical protein